MPERVAAYFLYPYISLQKFVVDQYTQYYDQQQTLESVRFQLSSLEKKYEQQVADFVALKSSIMYADETAELVSFSNRYDVTQMVLSQITLKHFSDQSHFFLVDAGHNQRVEVDMIAVYKNMIIGRVVEVFSTYSKVLAITDRTCNVAVYCGNTDAAGIYTGTNKYTHGIVTHVSHLSTVDQGDLVISSGTGVRFPQGFAVGTVSSCRIENLFYKITIEPLYDITKLRYCYLLKK